MFFCICKFLITLERQQCNGLPESSQHQLKINSNWQAFTSDQKYKQAACWISLNKGLESHYTLGPTYICKKNNP